MTITEQAKIDFTSYKDVKVIRPDGKEVIINRKGIEEFFQTKVYVRDLGFGYPDCKITTI